jgi:transposase
MMFIGLDWSRDKHDFALLDAEGRIQARGNVRHDAKGLAQLAEIIHSHESDPAAIHVVMELHDGALLAWLFEQGYVLYGLNPKSADRARDCYRAGGAKDDSLDAYVLADWGRMHYRTLRPLNGPGERTESIRCWVRLRARLVQDKTCACQRLRAILGEWAPTLSNLCDDFNRKWQQALLKACPLPVDLTAWHGNSLLAWARQRRLRQTTLERIRVCRSAPILTVPPARQDALRYEIRHWAQMIAQLTDHITHIEAQLQSAIRAHPDAAIFESLPVKGTATVSTLLAAFGEHRDIEVTWQERAARWGVAPVTVQSGRSRHVKRRCACDHTVNQALLFFAFKTAFTDGCWAADYYQKKRATGTDHYTTLRCLAQRWVKILHRLWSDRILYCEALHTNNRRTRGGAAWSAIAIAI